MVDPLQPFQSPYRTLGVTRDVDGSRLHIAFVEAISRVGHREAATARMMLHNPVERLFIDLFEYNDRFIAKLDPSPLEHADCLELAHREETAAAWENGLTANLGDFERAHCLGVAWYWRANSFAETRDNASRAGYASELVYVACRNAVAYWAWILSDEEAVRLLVNNDQLSIGQIRGAVELRLKGMIRDVAMALSATNTEISRRLQSLGCLFDYELMAIDAFVSIGLQLNGNKLTSGPTLHRRLRIDSLVGSAIGSVAWVNPGAEKFKRLYEFANGRGYVEYALLADNPQAVLDFTAHDIDAASRSQFFDIELCAIRALAGQEFKPDQATILARRLVNLAKAAKEHVSHEDVEREIIKCIEGWLPDQIEAAEIVSNALGDSDVGNAVKQRIGSALRINSLAVVKELGPIQFRDDVHSLLDLAGRAASHGDWETASEHFRSALDKAVYRPPEDVIAAAIKRLTAAVDGLERAVRYRCIDASGDLSRANLAINKWRNHPSSDYYELARCLITALRAQAKELSCQTQDALDPDRQRSLRQKIAAIDNEADALERRLPAMV